MKHYVLLFVLFLCFPTSAIAVQDRSSELLAATHGYVFVSFPKGGSTDLLTLQSVQDKHEYRLQPRADAGKSAFGAWLPAGDYRIEKWGDYPSGDYQGFRIEVGHLTNLGSFIPFPIGGYKIVMLPIRHPEVIHDVDAAIKEYRPYLESAEPIQWIPTAPPRPIQLKAPGTGLGLIADLVMEYERKVNRPSVNKQLLDATSVDAFYRVAIAATPPIDDDVAVDAASNLYYGADLGQIRVRHADGSWAAIDTGTLHRISAIDIKGNLLLAGSEDGVLRASNDNGASWRVLKSLPNDEAIVDIDYVSDRWLLSTLKQTAPNVLNVFAPILYFPKTKTPDLLRVYAARVDDFRDLIVVKEFPVRARNLLGAWFGGWLGVQGQAEGNFYYVSAYPELYRLDLSTMEWRTITPPAEVYGFHVSPRSGVLSAFKAMGFHSMLFVSGDHGESWKRYNAPPYAIRNINFDSTASGWAVRCNAGAVSAVLELLTYDHPHDSWQKFGEVPGGCPRVLRDETGSPRFFVTMGGSILSYQGGKLAVEFSTE